ncbi:MAG: hypothetical protein QOH84_1919 [Kribbellaceae bacterium]|nr:hypothetical protein [Kribbellaceae bacterium]
MMVAGRPAVRWERNAGVMRIVVEGVLTDAVSAAVRELLPDACGQGTEGVVLAFESALDPTGPEILERLVDVAQTYCWSASCRLEVTATDPEVCETLAGAGIWPSVQSGVPVTTDEGVGDGAVEAK